MLKTDIIVYNSFETSETTFRLPVDLIPVRGELMQDVDYPVDIFSVTRYNMGYIRVINSYVLRKLEHGMNYDPCQSALIDVDPFLSGRIYGVLLRGDITRDEIVNDSISVKPSRVDWMINRAAKSFARQYSDEMGYRGVFELESFASHAY